MRLSEMTTDQMADTLILLAEPIANIATDASVSAALASYTKASKAGQTVAETFGNMIGKLAPALLKSHRADLYAVVAALTGKTVEAIGAQKGLQTIADIRESFDGELADFFKSAADTAQAEPSQPLKPAPAR